MITVIEKVFESKGSDTIPDGMKCYRVKTKLPREGSDYPRIFTKFYPLTGGITIDDARLSVRSALAKITDQEIQFVPA